MEIAEKMLNCELCGKKFTKGSSRNRHVREQHLKPGLYNCKKCGLRFSKKYNLQKHEDRVHLNSRLKCTHCSAMFAKLTTLKKHVRIHNKDFTANFSTTPKHIKDEDAQTLAQSVLQELKQLQNDIQPSVDIFTENLDKEQELTADEKGMVEVVNIKDTLYPVDHFVLLKVQRIKRLDGENYFICEFCSKEFRKSYNYLRHRRIHTKVRPFICILCKKSFPTTSQLKRHCSIHKLDENYGQFHKFYKCPGCNERFCAMQQLDNHLCSVPTCSNVWFKCAHCSKSYKTLKTLLYHKHSRHDNELEMLKTLLPKPLEFDINTDFLKDQKKCIECHFCGIEIPEGILLKQHERRHENLFMNQCTECRCSFATHIALNIHSKIHLNTKKFKCHYCIKSFQTVQSCRRHMLTHLKILLDTHGTPQDENHSLISYPTYIETENKYRVETEALLIIKSSRKRKASKQKSNKNTELKYSCSKCDKSFRYMAWLKKHYKYKHTPPLLHDCNNCLKKFRTKQSLESHLVLHSSNRVKVTCQVCGRQYASSKSLKLHLRIHTQEKPFQCYKCSKLFRTSGHLIQHRKSNHDN